MLIMHTCSVHTLSIVIILYVSRDQLGETFDLKHPLSSKPRKRITMGLRHTPSLLLPICSQLIPYSLHSYTQKRASSRLRVSHDTET